MLQPSRLVKPCLTCLARCRRAPCQCAAEQTRPTHGPKSQAYRDPGRLKRSTDQRAAINALGLRSRRGPFATQCFSTAESSCPCHHRCCFQCLSRSRGSKPARGVKSSRKSTGRLNAVRTVPRPRKVRAKRMKTAYRPRRHK